MECYFHILCERRPFLCTVIQLIFLSFRGVPEFLGAYHVLFSLSLNLFYVDSFIAGASKTQEDTL